MRIDEVLLLEDDPKLKSIFKDNLNNIISYARKIQHYSKANLINVLSKLNVSKIDFKKLSRTMLLVIVSAAMLSSSIPQIQNQLNNYINSFNVASVESESESLNSLREQAADDIRRLIDNDLKVMMKELDTNEVIAVLSIQNSQEPYQNYLKYFEELTGTKPTTRIAKVNLGSHNDVGVSAYCNRGLVDKESGRVITPIILINSVFWGKKTEQEKRALVIHELAHCELGLIHIEEPDNIMSPGHAGGYNLSDPEIEKKVYDKFKSFASKCGYSKFPTSEYDLMSFKIYSGGCEARRLVGRW